MWYAIIAEDHPDSSENRKAARPDHLLRLQALQAAGRLFVAGPHPAIDTESPGQSGFTGSLIIAEFDSLEDAQQWAGSDPYVNAGVYAKVVVKPFIKALP